MKHLFTSSLSKSMLSKLVLSLALILMGSSPALADRVIFGGSVADGWKYTTDTGTNAYVSSSTLSNYNSGSSGAFRYYTSDGVITINAGEKIIISAKKYGTSSGERINVNYSSDNGDTWETAAYFEPSDKDNYAEFEVTNLAETAYKLQFEFRYVNINSIIIKSAPTAPELSITLPASGKDFGYITKNTTKTFTVKNVGVGSMDVNISSSDPAFTVSTSSLTGITNDGVGKTFDVTFNYDAENPQLHSASITVTVVGGGKSQVIDVTAGPDVEFNEDKATSWKTGSGKNIFVKYTATNGWNTISFPLAVNTYKTQLFGSGATVKGYALSSYSDGIITFEAANYMAAGTPYVVYVENAASAPFIIENVYVGYTSGSNVIKGDDAKFQGTFAPIAAGAMTGNYGLTPSGQIRKAGSGASLKGYRAYFTGISAPSTGVKMIVIEEDGGETDLGIVKMVDEKANDVYTLAGQKVQKGRKGIYIVNGKKVVIK